MRPVKLLITALLFALLLIVALGFYLPGFLSVDKPVSTSNVLIESWISHREIEQAVEQFRNLPGAVFYVVGQTHPEIPDEKYAWPGRDDSIPDRNSTGIWLYANSSMNCRVPARQTLIYPDTVLIVVEAKGQEAVGRFAYFNLVVNGKSLGGAFSQTEYKEYSFQWVSRGQPLRALYVSFVNDLYGPGRDRNLNVRSVTINGIQVDCNRTTTFLTRERNTLTTGYGSQAGQVASYIKQLGVPGDKVVPVEFIPPKRNLTLAAANQFKKFGTTNTLDDFNVISSGIHCRRTWITYKRVFGKDAEVGIINYSSKGPDPYTRDTETGYVLHLLDESAVYLVNWFQLIFN